MSTYECVVTRGSASFDARVAISPDGLQTQGRGGVSIPFSDLMDMRLPNYRVLLRLREEEVQITQLGYQTEDFFEKLWQAYAAKSRASLFVDARPLMESEGDYAYDEPSGSAHGIAKLEVFSDCVCLHPHDVGARRIPLCFADGLEREGFSLTLTLDTGERYRLFRLGRDTEGFFRRVEESRKRCRAQWDAAHRGLERNLKVRLGDAYERYVTFAELGANVVVGLFSPDDEGFWFAAVGSGRAAVELITDEDTATYLYRYNTDDASFVRSLRHAMEAVRRNRRIVFLSDEEIEHMPLYRMALDRSAHVRFLRSCNAGRVIHTQSWERKLREFFG